MCVLIELCRIEIRVAESGIEAEEVLIELCRIEIPLVAVLQARRFFVLIELCRIEIEKHARRHGNARRLN